MSSTNQGPEYFTAEKNYLNSKTAEDKIYWLGEMIKNFKKHKGSEKMLAELKKRLIRFEEKAEKNKKKSAGRKGIRKEGFQFVLIGKANSGKSSLLKALTNANPLIVDYPFATSKPELGTFSFFGVSAQIIDMPSIGSEGFDIGIVNTADCLIFVVEDLIDINEIEEIAKRNHGGRIIVLAKGDRFDNNEMRKVKDRIRSKKIEGLVVSAEGGEGIDELKGKMFSKMGVIRVYTKEPGKVKAEKPIVLKAGSSVHDAAEEILKGFSLKVRETRLTGPSGKFPNQIVGLSHKLRDLDVVEFHIR